MRHDFSRHAPPGLDLGPEKKIFAYGMLLATLFSLGFFVRLSRRLGELYWYQHGELVLMPGVRMTDFADVLGSALLGFPALALCMAALIAYHYSYHYRGSKSIYLMRRLPDRWELHRRCLTLPLLGATLCLLAAFLLLLVYFAIYMKATPPECLTGGQWQKLWR